MGETDWKHHRSCSFTTGHWDCSALSSSALNLRTSLNWCEQCTVQFQYSHTAHSSTSATIEGLYSFIATMTNWASTWVLPITTEPPPIYICPWQVTCKAQYWKLHFGILLFFSDWAVDSVLLLCVGYQSVCCIIISVSGLYLTLKKTKSPYTSYRRPLAAGQHHTVTAYRQASRMCITTGHCLATQNTLLQLFLSSLDYSTSALHLFVSACHLLDHAVV